MRVINIQNRINSQSFSFERRLRKDEEADFQKTNEEGFKASGADKRVAITHGSVFPAVGRNSYMGSPYGAGAKEWIKLLTLNGFNGMQLGPNGRLSTEKPTEKNLSPWSPYNSSALSENHLFAELEPLTTSKYGNILSKETYEDVTDPLKKTNKNYSFVDFQHAKKVYFIAFNEAFKNFKTNLAKGQPETIKLNSEYESFIEKKGKQVEEEGIFRVLASLNETENLDKWDNKLDANLMKEVRKGNPRAKERYNEIIKNHKKSIEEYGFEQFIVTKQIKENKEFRDNIGFEYYSDFLVGCSQMDKWRYKEAFLDDYAIGAFEYNGPHQIWNIPVLNPRMLFVGEDELNIGGKFLKEKIDHALENCENTRIDHALGLIEPFVYKASTVHYDNKGDQIKENIVGNYMSQLKDNKGRKLDDYDSYRNILERVILPSLKEHGLDKTDAVWEHICSEPPLFSDIYYNKYSLPRLIQTEYMKDELAGDNHWYVLGSHDSRPAMTMLSADDDWRRYHPAWEPLYLAGYLNQDAPGGGEVERLKDLVAKNQASPIEKATLKRAEERNEFCDEIANDDVKWTKAKFTELFTKKKLQVSFADILGITDPNVIYNIGGSNNKFNWKERMAPDFVDKYYENLSSENPTALNIPEILGKAVLANIQKQIVAYDHSLADNEQKAIKIEAKRQELYNEHKELLNKLKHYEEVLKEKE